MTPRKILRSYCLSIYNKTAPPEQIVWEHLNNEVVNPSDVKRKIQYLKLDTQANLGNKSIQYQNSYGVVAEEVETLCILRFWDKRDSY
ncbi:hypothetical protein KEH51_29095 [[Brevibacterium] frigoritolerans]|uniref:Gp28/Gp37-like domain-containing protein n=1 Tax=Peribacillus frigoritolerans TaxID=450367 RepID=A0A941FKH9_9BACI|nr:hypothetical protein [Peribacillus frigoritolerans]